MHQTDHINKHCTDEQLHTCILLILLHSIIVCHATLTFWYTIVVLMDTVVRHTNFPGQSKLMDS